MESLLLIDGEIPNEKELLNLFEGRDLLSGRTPFTSTLIVNGKIPFWDLHFMRLKKSFEYLYGDHDFKNIEKQIQLSLKHIKKEKKANYLRLTMLEVGGAIKLITQIKPIESNEEQDLKLCTSNHPARVSSLPNYLKYGNYLESMLKVKDSKTLGFDDCLFLDSKGHASECSVSNIFFRVGNRFFTPSLDGPVLDGVTRRMVIELMKENKMTIEEMSVNRSEWEAMDEVFITNSLKGLVPVSQIDSREFEIRSKFFIELHSAYSEKLRKL